MPRLRLALVPVLAALLAMPAAADDVSMDASQAESGAYRLETSHSQILFAIRHMGLTEYYGRFDKMSGTLNYNSGQPEHSAVSVSIDTASVDTPSARLNDTLKGADVFNTAKFADATFKSTAMRRIDAGHGTITGDLTIRGITKPVTLNVTFNGTENNPLDDSRVLGFHAETTIKRSDYGMTGMIWEPLVGDDIRIIIEAMFQRESE
jgi:polyisoprenoid-binding protein YceI